MIIETSARLHDWCGRQAQAAGILDGLDPAAAAHAVECIASVVWRHAIGQGLRPGNDWGWILEMYDPARLREIAQAAAETYRPRGQ